MCATPLVSIIMAAYNRSNVLRLAIQSVLRSSFSNWELIVIGDACTDDTEEAVSAFADPRISFFNLEINSGNQSAPNNEGFCRAKGRYIAYLNQDDLWFPDHLEKAVSALEETGADWVFPMGVVFFSPSDLRVYGALPDGRYDPRYGQQVVGSFWVLKREVLEEIGGWRDYRTIRIAPSQELLQRAWKAKKDIRMVFALTASHFPSGLRKNSYVNRDFLENSAYLERMCTEKSFRETELLRLIYVKEASSAKNALSIRHVFRAILAACAYRLGWIFGVTPVELLHFLRSGRKGIFIEQCQKTRGLK